MSPIKKQFGYDYPLLEFGLYDEQLLRYFKFFPREQICIQLSDDYLTDPAATFAALFRFPEDRRFLLNYDAEDIAGSSDAI